MPGTRSCVPTCKHIMQIPPSLITWAVTGFPYKITTLLIIFTVEQKGHLHHNFLLHFWTKARPCWRCSCWHQVGAACRLLWYNQLSKIVPQPWGIPAWGHGAHTGSSMMLVLQSGSRFPHTPVSYRSRPGQQHSCSTVALQTCSVPWRCVPIILPSYTGLTAVVMMAQAYGLICCLLLWGHHCHSTSFNKLCQGVLRHLKKPLSKQNLNLNSVLSNSCTWLNRCS